MSNSGGTTVTADSSAGTIVTDIGVKGQEHKDPMSKNMEETALQLLNNTNDQPIALPDIKTTLDLNINSIREILRNYTGDQLLEIESIGELEDMSGMNDAFNSSICSLHCVATFRDGEAKNTIIEKEFNFVVKCPPTSKFIQFAHKFTKPFCNEVSWYLDLVKQLQLTQPVGAPPVLGDTLPECYHAVSSYHTLEGSGDGDSGLSSCWFCIIPCKPKEEGLLILENVKHRPNRSYRMFPKIKPVPLNHVELIIKKLAQFHGLWLQYRYLNVSGRLKSQNPNAEIIPWPSFLRRFMVQKKVPKILYKSLKSVAKKSIIRILTKEGPDELENIQKCRRFFDHTANRTLNTMFNESPSPEVHTLCHGDFWSNNIMFYYSDENEDAISSDNPSEQENCTPIDLILIDFQLINYSNPCYDLVYFLYLNTDLAFRDNHLEDILKMYYHEFSQYFPTDIPECSEVEKLKEYTFDKFMEDFNFHRIIGMVTACAVMPNVFADSPVDLEGNLITAFNELQRKQQAIIDDETSPSSIEIRRRLVDLVHEFAREGGIL